MYTFEIMLFLFQTMLRILTWFMVKTPKQGAQTTIHVAVSKDLKGVSGKVIVLLHRWTVYNHILITCTWFCVCNFLQCVIKLISLSLAFKFFNLNFVLLYKSPKFSELCSTKKILFSFLPRNCAKNSIIIFFAVEVANHNVFETAASPKVGSRISQKGFYFGLGSYNSWYWDG